MHMSRKHMGMVDRRGQQHALFVMLVGCAKQFQATEARFLLNSTDSLCLQVIWMPESRDLAIFMPTTTCR